MKAKIRNVWKVHNLIYIRKYSYTWRRFIINSVESGIFITYELIYILDNHSFLPRLFFLSEGTRFSSERKLILFRKKIKFLSDVFTPFFRKEMQIFTKKGRIHQTED